MYFDVFVFKNRRLSLEQNNNIKFSRKLFLLQEIQNLNLIANTEGDEGRCHVEAALEAFPFQVVLRAVPDVIDQRKLSL